MTKCSRKISKQKVQAQTGEEQKKNRKIFAEIYFRSLRMIRTDVWVYRTPPS